MKSRDEHIALLRTFAVLLQRGAEVSWEPDYLSMSDRDKYSVTIKADQLEFWRTYNEIHAEQVKRDGEAWLRTQGRQGT